MKYRMLERLLVAVVAAIFLLDESHSGQDRTFEPQSRELINSLHKILIDAGRCRDDNDCVRQQYVLWSPRVDGVWLTVYGVADKTLIAKSFGAISECYMSLPQGARLSVVFRTATKAEDLRRNLLKPDTPFAEIYISGDAHAKR
jgi:hypothetical protein